MSLTSMTGYAEIRGSELGANWVWEIRGVNGKGFDLRIRLPEGMDALDAQVRAHARQHIQRGTLNVSLKINREAVAAPVKIVDSGLMAALEALQQVEEAALAAGLHLGPSNAADILAQRGVLEAREADPSAGLSDAAAKVVENLFKQFNTMRKIEGLAIAQLLHGQISRIEELTVAAKSTLEARAAQSGAALRQRVAALMDASDFPDESRLAQELALISVKSDVSEELDRLAVHVEAARAILQTGGAVGRKLDFLMQEFNREANTLCSKSGSSELTNIGLDLKVVIDQAREQVQNVE